MMNKKASGQKVAIVTESLWKMGGVNRVLDSFINIFPDADIYALFGKTKYLSNNIKKQNIKFSFLNKLPFIKTFYRYTFHLWPIAVEQFDLSDYDLVISNSSSVAHGAITTLDCKHIAYINSPMRYAWDLAPLYTKIVNFNIIKRAIKEFFVNFNRTWDVVAAHRPEMIITNSDFVKNRVKKYWGVKTDYVISPPVDFYKGKTVLKRESYFISVAPFEPNKRGDFLMECASQIGFNLKVIGEGSMKKKLKRKYKKYHNIEILDWVDEKEKWRLLSKSKGLIVAGIEDYGISCAEAISCGTPVLALRNGGSKEIVKEDINGMFFDKWMVKNFRECLKSFGKKEWNYKKVRESLDNVNTREEFERKLKKVLVE